MDETKHWGSGSGMVGCLYDYGPNYSGTDKRQAAYDALEPFSEELTQVQYSEAVRQLVEHGVHYFPPELHGELGAQMVEVFEADPEDWADAIADLED